MVRGDQDPSAPALLLLGSRWLTQKEARFGERLRAEVAASHALVDGLATETPLEARGETAALEETDKGGQFRELYSM